MRSLLLTALLASASLFAAKAPIDPLLKKPVVTDRMIVKYKDARRLNASSLSLLNQTLQSRSSLSTSMALLRSNALGANIVQVAINGQKPTPQQMFTLAKNLSQLPEVRYAEPDALNFAFALPNDPYYNQQWNLQPTPGGANAQDAWEITTGSDSVVVAVIDTGVLAHQDLQGRLLEGYDFITHAENSRDGDGRDANASDAGDWCAAGEFCEAVLGSTRESSWHGTHVAGIIAANADNGFGISGVDHRATILPVRVLGTYGGFTSDIADGMLWAAGLSVDGVADNPNPADILNMSLGGSGPCSQTYQETIDLITAQTDALIVVAAGNEMSATANASPANCDGVYTVAAGAQNGGWSWYSNYGSEVDITAPGGDSTIDAEIYSTVDASPTAPSFDNAIAAYQGTSMATPHVSAAASLVKALKPNAAADALRYYLTKGVKPFVQGIDNECDTLYCGKGLLDINGSVALAADTTEAPRFTAMMLDHKAYMYDFESAADHLDPASSWSIEEGRLFSNPIDHNQTSSYLISLPNTQFYTISFDLGISSEANYDGVRFSVDGVRRAGFSGDGYKSYLLSGYASSALETGDGVLDLNWTYMKDADISNGFDRAYIDNLQVATYQESQSGLFTKAVDTKIISITNDGPAPLEITNILLEGSERFEAEHDCDTPLRFEQECTVMVIYTGDFRNDVNATLSFNTNDAQHSSVSYTFEAKRQNSLVPILHYLLF